MTQSDLSNEWSLLQSQYDSYEKYSLIIKLVAMVIFYGAHLSGKIGLIVSLLLTVFWFQDAIWKTFQSRIELRLLALEEALAKESDRVVPYQFNRDFIEKRPSQLGLLKEYVSQGIRPTVAFPHVILIILLILANI